MSCSRRELLAALVGAPIAAACRPLRRSVAGSVQGARIELGHRLLATSSQQVGGKPERCSVVIVGAGPSGLVAARRLERFGVRDYRVLDLERLVGGTSAGGYDGIVPHPWGAHYVPLPSVDQPELVGLLEEIGAVRRDTAGVPRAVERARVRAPEERLFLDGSWVEGLFPAPRATAADRAELRRFEGEIARLVAFRDERGRRAFTLPMRRCSDAEALVALDRLSAKQWLDEHGFRSPLLRWYVEYACRDDYGASLERTSAWAMLFYFCARVSDPGRDSAPFLTWPEGNARVVARLAAGLGTRLALGRLVTEVVPERDSVTVVTVTADGQSALKYRADDVILAVPKFVAHRLLRPLRENADALRADFHYAPWLVANVHLSERPGSTGFPFAWDNVLFDSPGLGYVVATHQTLADFGPTIWTYYRPFWEQPAPRAREVLRALDHATAVEAIVGDLARAHRDFERHVERIDVYRWGHGMVTPVPGFIWGEARRRASEPLERVAFAHSDTSGLPLLEEAIDRGVLAANHVLRRRGVPVVD